MPRNTHTLTKIDAIPLKGQPIDTNLMDAMNDYMFLKRQIRPYDSVADFQGFVYSVDGLMDVSSLVLPIAGYYFSFLEIAVCCNAKFAEGTLEQVDGYEDVYRGTTGQATITVSERAFRGGKRKRDKILNAAIAEDIKKWVTYKAATNSINPFGRFANEKIVVVHPNSKLVDDVKTLWKLTDNTYIEYQAVDNYSTDNNYHCILSLDGYKVYQYFPGGVPDNGPNGLDGFDGMPRNVKPAAASQTFCDDFAELNEDAKVDVMADATLSKFQDKRSSTNLIMKLASSTDADLKVGVSANRFAEIVKGSTPTFKKYEWLHRHAHGLGGADKPENLMLGTTFSNTFNIIDERITSLLLGIEAKRATILNSLSPASKASVPKPKKRPAIQTVLELGSGLVNGRNPIGIWNTIPKTMDYNIFFDGSLYCSRVNLSLYHTWAPSKWVNAITSAIVEEKEAAVLAPLIAAQQSQASSNSKGFSFLALRQNMLRSVSVPTIDKAFMSNLLGIAEMNIKEEVVNMTSDQIKVFYDQACQDDPAVKDVFPDPAKGVHDNERVVTFKCIVKLVECRVRSMMTFEDDGSVSHLTGLYLSSGSESENKSLITTLFHMDRQHLILNKYKDKEASPIVAAGVMKVSEMFSFVPNMPQDLELELSASFGSATRFDDIILNSGTVALSADLTGHIQLSSDVTLTEVTLATTILDQLDMSTGKTTRIYSPSLAATVNFCDHDPQFPCTFQAQVSKSPTDGSVSISGTLTDWRNPFGVPDVTLDTAALSLVLRNGELSADVSANLQIGNSLGIDFAGSWSKADGVGLFAQMEGVLDMSHVQDIHMAATRGESRVDLGFAPSDATVRDVRVSFCSKKKKTFLGTECPVGLCLHGTFEYEKVTAEVTIEISAEGVKFQGDIRNIEVVEGLTVTDIDLLMILSNSSKTQSFLQGSTSFKIEELGGFDVELLARLGKDRAAYAEVDHLGFDASKISPALEWLSFSFPKLAYSYTDKNKEGGMTIQLPTTQSNKTVLTPVHLDAGQVLWGSVSFGLLKVLLGQDMTLAFSYHFVGEKFVFTPQKPTGTLKAPRIHPAKGVSVLFTLTDFKVMKMGIECIVSIPSLNIAEVRLDTGFQVVEGSPGFDVSLFGSIMIGGEGLKIASDIYLKGAKISADILPAPGDIRFSGIIEYMENEIDACVQIAEDPDRDGFVISLHHDKGAAAVSFMDLINFIPKLVGITLPTIPFLDDIKVNLMWAYWGGILGISYETEDGTKTFPSGFGFDVDLTAFGARFAAMLEVSETRVAMSLDIPKISLADGAFAVAGYNGRNGPHFDMDFSPTKAEINVDGSFKFLLLEVRALIHLKVATSGDVFDLDFQWKLLGLETDISIHYIKQQSSLKASFYLGDDHKKKANEAVLNKIKAAAKKMKEDALAVEQASASAVQAFTKGLKQLQDELDEAKKSEDTFATGMRSDIENELTSLHQHEADAKSDFEELKAAQKLQVGQLQKVLDKTVSDMHASIQDSLHRESEKAKAIQDEVAAWTKAKADWSANFKASSDAAQAQLDKAQASLNDEQKQLTTINNQDPPSGKGSDDDKKKYEAAKADAQRAVNASNSEIAGLKAKMQAISTSETHKLDELDRIHGEDSSRLSNDQKALRAETARLQGDLTKLEQDQVLLKEQLHTLSDLQAKRHAIENKYATTVKKDERVYHVEECKHSMHKTRITLDKAAADEQVARMNKIVEHNNGQVDPSPPTQNDINTAAQRVWDNLPAVPNSIEGVTACSGFQQSEPQDAIANAVSAYLRNVGTQRNSLLNRIQDTTSYSGIDNLITLNRNLNGYMAPYNDLYPNMLKALSPWMTAPDSKLSTVTGCFGLVNDFKQSSYWTALIPSDLINCSKDDLNECLQALGSRLRYLRLLESALSADNIASECYDQFHKITEEIGGDKLLPVELPWEEAAQNAGNDLYHISVDLAEEIRRQRLVYPDRDYGVMRMDGLVNAINENKGWMQTTVGQLNIVITNLNALIGDVNELKAARFPPLQEAIQNVNDAVPKLRTLITETHEVRSSIKSVFDEILLAIPRASLSVPTRSAVEIAVSLGIQKYKNVKGTAAASDALSRIMKYSDLLIPIDNRLENLRNVMTETLSSLAVDESLVDLIQKFIQEDSWSDVEIAAFEKEVSSIVGGIDMWASVVNELIPNSVKLATIKNEEQAALDNLRDALNDFDSAYGSLDDEAKALPFGPACDRVHNLLLKSHSLQKKEQRSSMTCPTVAVGKVILVSPACTFWGGYSEVGITEKGNPAGLIMKMTKDAKYHLGLWTAGSQSSEWKMETYGHVNHLIAAMDAAPHGSRAVLGVNGDWVQTGDLRRCLSQWGSPTMGAYPAGKPMAFCGTKGTRTGTGVLTEPLKEDEYRVSLKVHFPESPDGTKTFIVETADTATLWINEVRGHKVFNESGNLHFAVIDRITNNIIEEKSFDTSAHSFTADEPTDFLEKQPNGQIVLVIAKNFAFGLTALDSWTSGKFTTAMNKYGCSCVLDEKSYVLCGIKGATQGTVPECQARYIGKAVLGFSFTPMADRVNIIAEETVEGLDGYANRLQLIADDAQTATDLLKSAFSNNMFDFMDVRSALGDAASTIHNALIIERNKELYDKKLHDKAVAVQSQLGVQGTVADEQKQHRETQSKAETQALKDKAAKDLTDIDNQIAAEKKKIYDTINDAAKIAADAISAEQKMEKVLVKEEGHVNEIQQHVAQGIQAAKDWQDPNNIPSTSNDRVKDAHNAIEKWNSSDLAAHAAAAGADAMLAAKKAEAAAKLYEHMMKRNTMSFGSISASGDFSNDNCIFDIDVDLKFELHLDLGILGDIDISLPRVHFELHIDLSFIIQLVENAFKLLWKAITNAFNRIF